MYSRDDAFIVGFFLLSVGKQLRFPMTYTVKGFGSAVPGSILHSGKTFLQWLRPFWIPAINKGGPPVGLPSLWGMRVWTGSLLLSRTLGRDEEPLLSSGRTLIGSELSSPNFTHLSKWTIAVRYLNVVIKPLCGNLDMFLTTGLAPTFSRGILFACFSCRQRPKDAFLDCAFRSRSCTI